MNEIKQLPLVGKVFLRGNLKCVTGLHIGASKETLEIGGIDTPVVRDPLTRRPYIPGSSLKGKMRYLMERTANVGFNRRTGSQGYRHECSDRACVVCRLFGSTGGKEGENIPSRLLVRDLSLTEESCWLLNEMETPLQFTEWKFENALDRVTAAANPRQLERVPAGASFRYEIVFDMRENRDEAKEDLLSLVAMMNLLEDDALGGHGSRGYGKVRFEVNRMEARPLSVYDGSGGSIFAEEAEGIGGLVEKIDTILDAFPSGG